MMIDSHYSNCTLFGIKNDAERYTWAAWLILIFMSALFGDTIILTATIKYKAFNLHKFMVVCIQHIAVSDLLSLISISFRIVSVLANGWIFGKALGYIVAHFQYFSSTASLLLICSMTSSKLWLVKHPLDARHLRGEKAHQLCTCIWAVSLVLPATALIYDEQGIIWDQRLYVPDYAYNSTDPGLIESVSTALTCIPSATVIITSALLVKHLLNVRRRLKARKGKVRWHGIAAALTVAVVYNVSSLPVTAAYLSQIFLDTSDNTFSIALRASSTFFYFNVVSHFFVYYCTVKNFRGLINTRVQQMTSRSPYLPTKAGKINQLIH